MAVSTIFFQMLKAMIFGDDEEPIFKISDFSLRNFFDGQCKDVHDCVECILLMVEIILTHTEHVRSIALEERSSSPVVLRIPDSFQENLIGFLTVIVFRK